MKFLFDFFPLILFFIAFKVSDIFVATAVAIVASIVQIGWVLARRRKVSNMQWTGLAIIVVFGGATLEPVSGLMLSAEAYSAPSDLVTARVRVNVFFGGIRQR